jgi:flagellar protein FliO/FliZ
MFLLDSIIAASEDPSQFPEAPFLSPAETEAISGDYGFAILKLFLSLIIVIGLLGLTVWFLRRLIRYRLEKGSGVQAIKILEKKMISPKTMLYFVEVEGEKIILAESQLEVRQLLHDKKSRSDFST